MEDTDKKYLEHREKVREQMRHDQLMSSLGLPGEVDIIDATKEGLHVADTVLGGPAVRGMMDAPGGPVSAEGLAEGTEDVEGGEGSIRSALGDLGRTMVPKGGLEFGSLGSAEDPFGDYGVKVTKDTAEKMVPLLFELGLYGASGVGLGYLYSAAGRSGIKALSRLATEVEALAPEAVALGRETLASEAGFAEVGGGGKKTPKLPPKDPRKTIDSIIDLEAEIDPIDEALNLKTEFEGRKVEPASGTYTDFKPVNYDDLPETTKEAWGRYDELVKKVDKAKASKGKTHAETVAAAKAKGMSPEEVAALDPSEAVNAEQTLSVLNANKKQAKSVRGAANKWAKTQSPEDLAEFERQFRLLQEVEATRFAQRAEAGRTLDIVNEATASQDILYLKQFSEAAGGDMTAERAAMMVNSLNTEKQIIKYAEQLASTVGKETTGWRKIGDAWTEAYLNIGLLSSPKTHIRNIAGNTVALSSEIGARAIAPWVPGSGAGGVVHGEATAMVYGIVDGWKDGMKIISETWQESRSMQDYAQRYLSKMEFSKVNAISGEAFGLDGGFFAGALDFVGKATRIPGRALVTMDDFFRYVNRRAFTYAKHHREGITKGLTGKASREALEEAFHNPSYITRAEADAYAAEQTFNNALGPQAQKVMDVLRGSDYTAVDVISKTMIPFIRTPLNIFHYANKRTPLGLFYTGVRDAIRAGGAGRDLALARMGMGTAMMGTVWTLSAAEKITGEGPRNPVLRQAWLALGNEPYSIKIGDKWIPYGNIEPLSMILQYSADVLEVIKTGDLSGEDHETLAHALFATYVAPYTKNFSSKMFLQGMSDIVTAIMDEDGHKLERVFKQFPTRLVPAGEAEARKFFSPSVREAITVMDKLKKRSGWGAKNLPLKRNLFGQPMLPPGSMGTEGLSPFYAARPGEKHDAIWNEVYNNQMRITMPQKERRIGTEVLELTAKQYETHILKMNKIKIGGLNMIESLTKAINSPAYKKMTEGPEGGKAQRLTYIVNQYKKDAFSQMLDTDKDLQRQYIGMHGEKIQKRTGTNPVDQMQQMFRGIQ